jgi:hypothetical protein
MATTQQIANPKTVTAPETKTGDPPVRTYRISVYARLCSALISKMTFG